jgi:hypothetical protein
MGDGTFWTLLDDGLGAKANSADATHIIVGNDNNLPYSTGRTLGKQDDNELILLAVPEFLAAK